MNRQVVLKKLVLLVGEAGDQYWVADKMKVAWAKDGSHHRPLVRHHPSEAAVEERRTCIVGCKGIHKGGMLGGMDYQEHQVGKAPLSESDLVASPAEVVSVATLDIPEQPFSYSLMGGWPLVIHVAWGPLSLVVP